jgi:hypothetical protein
MASRQRTGIGFGSGYCIDRERLAGKHGLVDQDRSLDQAHVRRNDRPQRQLDDIAGNQFGGLHGRPFSIAPCRCDKCQPRLQRIQRRLRTALLKIPQASIEQQQKRDHGGLDVISKPELQQNRGFEHPGHRRPQLVEGASNRVLSDIGDGVRTVMSKAPASFTARQTDERIG